jgi:hypothetical protein
MKPRKRRLVIGQPYFGWCENVHSDINAISNKRVKAQAKKLFEKVLSASGFVEKYPDKVEEWVRPKIEELAA